MAVAAPAAEATAAPAAAATVSPAAPAAKATAAPAVTVFRQALTALRYAVAAAVTVVVVMTAVYAFHVLTRTDDLYIDVVNSYIFVDQGGNGTDPKVSFTLSVDNPSGRVRFYYTGIQCELKVNDSSTDNSTAKFDFPDMVVAPDSVLQIGTEAKINNGTNKLIDDLKKNSGRLSDANLTLTGNLTVGVYSEYNKTIVPTTYYCTSVAVGNVSDPWGRAIARGKNFAIRGKPIQLH